MSDVSDRFLTVMVRYSYEVSNSCIAIQLFSLLLFNRIRTLATCSLLLQME